MQNKDAPFGGGFVVRQIEANMIRKPRLCCCKINQIRVAVKHHSVGVGNYPGGTPADSWIAPEPRVIFCIDLKSNAT